MFCTLKVGFFEKNITLVKREDGYDLMKAYNDRNGQEQVVCIGKTFQVKNRSGNIIEGLSQGTLGLISTYNKDKQKNVTDSSDALFITTHKLKEPKRFGDKGFMKVGYITGKFGIEIEQSNTNQNEAVNEIPEYDDDGEQIPF